MTSTSIRKDFIQFIKKVMESGKKTYKMSGDLMWYADYRGYDYDKVNESFTDQEKLLQTKDFIKNLV